jgi:Arc/MetJ-type ribon-helix-helix transcriptional regulator
MDDDLKGLFESMSEALKDAIRGSEKLQELLHEIESRG